MRDFSKTNFTLLMILFAVVLALAAMPVCAQQTSQSSPSPDTPSKEKTQGETLSGSVVDVDSTNKTIRIKDDQGTEHTINVDSSTKIQKAGKSAKLSDIKSGDHITATVKRDSSGRVVASSIDVREKGDL
jgi:Cu/Ag efflux protein CusF